MVSGAPERDGGADLVIHDVASHSLGVKALDPKTQRFVNSVIIPRFTEVPSSRTRTFATKQDNQERVEVEVLQGEDADPNSPEVHLVGRVQLKNLPPHKAGELIIEVTLSYDADGVIEVTARESKSGQMIREVVMSKARALVEAELRKHFKTDFLSLLPEQNQCFSDGSDAGVARPSERVHKGSPFA